MTVKAWGAGAESKGGPSELSRRLCRQTHCPGAEDRFPQGSSRPGREAEEDGEEVGEERKKGVRAAAGGRFPFALLGTEGPSERGQSHVWDPPPSQKENCVHGPGQAQGPHPGAG